MEGLKLQYANLEHAQNRAQHRTEGLKSSSLVVRRGQPFRLTLVFSGPYYPNKDGVILRIELDRLYYDLPITFSQAPYQGQWSAYIEPSVQQDPRMVSVWVVSPPNASIGVYKLSLLSVLHQNSCSIGHLTLLCNPWCTADSVFLSNEGQREEYVLNDFGLLYQGTAKNISFSPWGFDQYESDILEICMMLLQVSPEHQKNWRTDYVNRSDPVYISRIVSAMINCNDDCGVLMGKWTEGYNSGISPAEWTGSGEILRQWAKSRFSPVKYGQCWVFAAVMCTVMRVLGIPTRVVTNYNSAHDTNANLVIEEFYNEKGQKLARGRDSIWNFHVWVECWMRRKDLEPGFDGWQVVDPTPQEKSGGVFRCGPAPVKAVRERRLDMTYDIPFIFAEVNADVNVYIVRHELVLGFTTDTERVGTLILTKSVGSNKPQDLTSTYKGIKALPSPTVSRNSSMRSSVGSRSSRGPEQGLSVVLTLHAAPVFGENVIFSVTVTNEDDMPKKVTGHMNAQAKRYHCSPSNTLWEARNNFQLAPNESKVMQYQIPYSRYAELENDQLINLAAVITDVASQERELAFEEFNITRPMLYIEVADEGAIVTHRRQVAMVTFTNPFSMPVRGMLAMAGSALLDDRVLFNTGHLQPRQTMRTEVHFIPRMAGVKMLHASLKLENNPSVIRGFRTVTVQPV